MLTVPASFRDMPRWTYDREGRDWLEDLPQLAREQCRRWDLDIDGPPTHGSNALVVPVRRGTEHLALRIAPPGDDIAYHARALALWDGRGMVRLHEADLPHRAMLLERLDASCTLTDVPLRRAVEVMAGLTTRLAVEVPAAIRSTAAEAADLADTLEADWELTGRPMPVRHLRLVLEHAHDRSATDPGNRATDGDLHTDQVLAGQREPWLVVDPVLLRGDPEYDLGRVLWCRLDEVADDTELIGLFDLFVDIAGVPVREPGPGC